VGYPEMTALSQALQETLGKANREQTELLLEESIAVMPLEWSEALQSPLH